MTSSRNREIDWVRDNDVDEIVSLFSLVFDRPMTAEYYRWQFFREDKGRYDSVISRVGDQIVSHAGFSVRRWLVNGSDGVIMAKHTSMTHPDYRGQSLYGDLLEWAHGRFADMGVQLILSWPNRYSHPMQRSRSTYEDVYQIPTLKRSIQGSVRTRIDSIPFAKVESIDLRGWAGIAHEAPGNSLFTNQRTLDYLTWRFQKRPDTTYYAIEYRIGGELLSALIFKLFPQDEPDRINIVEWLCEPDSREGPPVLDELEQWAESVGLHTTIWHNVHDYPRHHILERRGYVPAEPIFYFGVIPTSSSGRLGSYRDWRNWYMSMGDVDVF